LFGSVAPVTQAPSQRSSPEGQPVAVVLPVSVPPWLEVPVPPPPKRPDPPVPEPHPDTAASRREVVARTVVKSARREEG
jgi:hypothetical protein